MKQPIRFQTLASKLPNVGAALQRATDNERDEREPRTAAAGADVRGGDRALTVNLQAQDNFARGDIGHVIGHRVSKATKSETQKGSTLVTALQEVKLER